MSVVTSVPASRRSVVEDLAEARALRSDPIAVIRRKPRLPMRGDDRPDRRLTRRLSASTRGRADR